jgi:3-deoxy-D-manno-octulosonate 8-phosphate phosphatase (KDO 8-P phosphatase)
MLEFELTKEVLAKARKVKLLLMDCDGVLTDGRLYFTEKGEEMKVFHVRDGQGIVMWHQAGFQSGIISGRKSKILHTRASELGMRYVKDGSQDKAKDLEDIIQLAKVGFDEVAFIGDDIADICLMEKIGFAVAVADAVQQVSAHVKYTTKASGGYAAVREVTDLLIKAKKST